MPRDVLRARIEHHLQVLVGEIGARPPGSPANRRATEHARRVLTDAGLHVRSFPFTTRWWEPGPGKLITSDGPADVVPNPYSPPCAVSGPAVLVGSLEALETLGERASDILVLSGELTREPVMPKSFPFYNPDEHRRIRGALGRIRPAGIVAVSEQWQPIFEDPDLPFPSTSVPPALGARLHDGRRVRLELGGQVHIGPGATVSGTLPGPVAPRIVLSAHLDSKVTTPGAFDNAGSVAVLLALAVLDLPDTAPLEVVLFNGEDHFDACGELAWLSDTDLGEVAVNVNLDGIGLVGHGTSLSCLACPASLAGALEVFVAEHPGWSPAEPWMESDHAIFAMQGIPAVAVTSDDVHALLAGLAHGPRDTLEVVDVARLAQVALDLQDLLHVVARERRPAPA
jgi:aminopeptidase YwaD